MPDLKVLEARFPKGSVVEAVGPYGSGSADYGVVEFVTDDGYIEVCWDPEKRRASDLCLPGALIPLRESGRFLGEAKDVGEAKALARRLTDEGVATEVFECIVLAECFEDVEVARRVTEGMGTGS